MQKGMGAHNLQHLRIFILALLELLLLPHLQLPRVRVPLQTVQRYLLLTACCRSRSSRSRAAAASGKMAHADGQPVHRDRPITTVASEQAAAAGAIGTVVDVSGTAKVEDSTSVINTTGAIVAAFYVAGVVAEGSTFVAAAVKGSCRGHRPHGDMSC